MKLDGRVIVVSGSASGIGAGTARQLCAAADCRLVLLDRNEAAGREVAAAIGKERAAFYPVDITSREDVDRALEAALERFGAVHALINCAGVVDPIRILDRDGLARNCAAFERVVAINLVGAFNLMAHCVEAMARNEPGEDGERGVVVNVSSGAAFDGQQGQTAYAASKAGIAGLSLPAARELARLGIRVNAIAPGAFDTPMIRGLNETIIASLLQMAVFPQRFGDVDEFAGLCRHIIENRFINGECIRLDGAVRLSAR